MRVAILSPHCDDVPLSLGATLLTQALGVEPTVHLVFSLSRYTASGGSTGDVGIVTAIRQAEERKAAALARYRPVFWNLPELTFRRSKPPTGELPLSERDVRQDSIWSLVTKTLDDHLNSAGIELLLAPLAAGNHFDHHIVRHAAMEYVREHAHVRWLGFYEDLPYAAWLPPDRLRLHVEHTAHLEPRVIGAGFLGVKLALLQCYPSQLANKMLKVVARHLTTIGGERLWLPPAAAALIRG